MPIPHGVVAIDDDHAVAVQSPLVIAIWRNQTTAKAVNELRTIITDAGRHAPRGLALVQVVENSASMPDSAGRQALGDMLNGSRPSVKCSAVVYEGDGFKAAAVRAIVSSLNLVAKPPFPHRIFATIEAGAAWHVAEMRVRLNSNMTQPEYMELINSVRGQIAAAKRIA